MGPKSGFRTRLFRAVHVEGAKRGLDHDGLRAMALEHFGVHSMADLKDEQLVAMYKGWTGKGLKRTAKLPRAGEAAAAGAAQMVSADELEAFEMECAKRGWGVETKRNFVRRQLGGRDVIRTRRDFARVFAGVRAMNRREATA